MIVLFPKKSGIAAALIIKNLALKSPLFKKLAVSNGEMIEYKHQSTAMLPHPPQRCVFALSAAMVTWQHKMVPEVERRPTPM